MKIAIWTKSPPKIEAIKEAVNDCIYFEWKKIEYIFEKVESWISDSPTSLEENIEWAKNRAKNLKKVWIEADFYVWMEWWTTKIWNNWFLFWVIYIEDNSCKWSLWVSPMMQLPESFYKRIYENHEQLWDIIKEISWDESVWHKTWVFWHLSDDMLTRKSQFIHAFTAWICPFFNKNYK